ncbi:MAG TPA: glycosyltransferase family 4 protein [Coleofasciculaceae cyanobacterium]
MIQTFEDKELLNHRHGISGLHETVDAIAADLDPQKLRILIVAEHASMRFGGEASLPLHYFRVLRQRGIETWLVVHERTRQELMAYFPEESDRIYFVSDSVWHKILYSTHQYLPRKIFEITLGFAMGMLTQWHQRRLVKKLVKEQRIDVIHQPIYVSPKTPSLIFGMGAPVIMGPMNGGMSYPPGFQHMENRFVRLSVHLGRLSSGLLNSLIPGKKLAATLLVANQRTREALPPGTQGKVIELVENGVDLSIWHHNADDRQEKPNTLPTDSNHPSLTRFVFVGRLVDWKGVDLLLMAFKKVLEQVPAELEIIGEGSIRATLEQLAQGEMTPSLSHEAIPLHLKPDSVKFSGWLSPVECMQHLQRADVLVLPSLFESGGAVVLEAMSMGLPVIATQWGGPTDYINEQCGVLIPPISPEFFVNELAAAMVKLAQSPKLRTQMGQVGRQRVLNCFDWEKKVDTILDIYAETVNRTKVQNS